MNQKEISEKTGIAQSNVSRALKAIRELSFVPGNVRAVLDALGWKITITKGGKKMFIEVKINGDTKLLNVDRIVEIEPTGETTNILVTDGYNCQGYNIECSYADFKKELTELELY